jgi:hypothetical protein
MNLVAYLPGELLGLAYSKFVASKKRQLIHDGEGWHTC